MITNEQIEEAGKDYFSEQDFFGDTELAQEHVTRDFTQGALWATAECHKKIENLVRICKELNELAHDKDLAAAIYEVEEQL